MMLAGSLLGFAGSSLIVLFREGEFAGSAADEARRIKFRRLGVGVALLGVALIFVDQIG